MRYVVVIPSWRRSHLINQLSLATLKRYSVPNGIIYVFVSDEQDLKAYKAVVEKGINVVNVNTVGITPTRDAISDYFPVETKIVSLDDDIEEIQFTTDLKTLHPIKALNEIVLKGFQSCEQVGATIWGIYPVRNAFFMKKTISTNLCFICAYVFGYINKHDPDIKVVAKVKDDYERCILLYLRDGALIRMNYICAKQKFYREDGGASTYRTKEVAQADADYLVSTYPMFLRHNTARSSGFAEIIFKTTKGV